MRSWAEHPSTSPPPPDQSCHHLPRRCPARFDPGETYDCTFTLYVGGNAGDTVDDTVTFTVEDDDDNTTTGTADEDVIIDDVLPTVIATKDASVGSVDEPGAQVEFATSVTNTSPEPVTITGLTDAVEGGTPFGVTAVGGPVLATTCDDAIGTILQPAETYDCTFTLYVRGDVGDLIDDEVAFTVEDDDDNATSGTAEDDVTVDDVLPTITATKDAAVGSVDEPGEDVSFDASVTNTSPEPVTITSVLDSVDGGFPFDVTSVAGPALATTCDDALGTILQPAETYDCSFVVAVSGFSGDVVEDIVSFTVEDDDGNETSATADEDIAIDDVVPTISVDKDASVESVDEPGDEVTFTATVTNTSLEPVTIDSVRTPSRAPVLRHHHSHRPRAGHHLRRCGRHRPRSRRNVHCDFRLLVAGNAGDVVIDTVTFTVEDDDQNRPTRRRDRGHQRRRPEIDVTRVRRILNAVAEPGTRSTSPSSM